MALITKNNTKKIFDNYISNVTEDNTAWYAFLGKITPWVDNNNPDVEDSSGLTDISIQKELMCGKRIGVADVSFMITNNTWQSNTIYDSYDDTDTNLSSKTYFITNTNNDIFKCLSNNKGIASTSEPISVSNSVITTADGYMWKYMYSLSSANNNKFSTGTLIPVDNNTSIETSAISGAIDVIEVTSGGSGYIFNASGNVEQFITSQLFKVSIDSAANGSYTNSGFFVTGGTGINELAVIDDFYSNSSGRYISLSTSIVTDTTTTFSVTPQIKIEGDGVGATAYSSVDANNTIDSVVILNSGNSYTTANVTVLSNDISTTNATFKVIIPPLGGHGKNPETELSSETMCFTQTFVGYESNTISKDIAFRQIGIISEVSKAGTPVSTNTISMIQTFNIDTSGSPASFEIGEIFTGQTSLATGIVAFANTTEIQGIDITGTFSNTEMILGGNSGGTATNISIINPDIDKYTGDVIYYENVSEIQRANTTQEQVKFLIKV